jgi:hypothetical protein
MGDGGHVPIKSSPGIYAGAADAPPVSGPGPAPLPPPDNAPTGIAGAAAGAAANAGVPGDVQSSTLEDLDRRMRALEAARKFPAQDAEAAGQKQCVGAQAGDQQATQMIQQMVSSITGAIGGAVGGLMKPLEEIPQQAMQAMQPLMSALQQGHGAAGLASDEQLVDSLGSESGLGSGAGGGAGEGLGSGGGGTVPAGYMGPPPVPTSSPPTTPAAARSVSMPSAGGTPPGPGPTGMTGMPMMPPGAMGAGGAGENKDKPAEKRVTAPAVPNGQPVKGRMTPPPTVPVTKSGEDKPPVVTRSPRRIVIMPSDEDPKE